MSWCQARRHLGLRRRSGRSKSQALRLVVLDLSDERLALAKRFGADVTLNPTRDDVPAGS